MEPVTKTRGPDAKLKGFPLPNGTEKNTHRTPPPPLLPAADEEEKVLYRECLKNHAASLGTHALDGCGEFMPSLEANPGDPTSLKCAACGCHRNFHRRITSPHRAAAASASGDDGLEGEGERDGQDDDGEEDADVDDSRPRSPSPPPPPYFTSAPHMLLALSSGVRGGDSPAGPGRPFTTPTSMVAVPPLRKRFRTKFSPEQKDRMLELSERLGWRLHRRDEEFVEKYCDEIGVGKGVFKVWMHNNKHHLFGHSASRRETGNGVSPSAFPGSGAGLHKPDGNGNAMNGAV